MDFVVLLSLNLGDRIKMGALEQLKKRQCTPFFCGVFLSAAKYLSRTAPHGERVLTRSAQLFHFKFALRMNLSVVNAGNFVKFILSFLFGFI